MVYLLGTHEYEWILRPFAYLFKKYWGNDKIIYVGDRQEKKLPDNIEFMQVPAYNEGIWDWKNFGNGLLSLLEVIDDDIITIFLPDQWLSKKVDKKGIRVLINYMRECSHTIRANLTAGTLYDGYGQEIDKIGNYSITSVSSDNIHAGLEGGITFCPSLWNVELLREIIQPDWDLWVCEKAGSDKMRFDRQDLMTIGTRPALLHRTHALFHNDKQRISFDGLNDEDIKTVKELCKSY